MKENELKLTVRKLVKLHIFDPWGTASDTYVGTTLPLVLRGQLEPGAEMQNPEKYTFPTPMNNNRIHVILIIFPLTMISSSSKIEGLVSMLKDCTSGGYDPILVVTHIDDFENMEERKPYMDKIREKFPNISIFFHQNYTKEVNRNPEIDLSSRLILRQIVQKANAWKGVHPAFFTGVNWKYETVLTKQETYCHNPKCPQKLPQAGRYCVSCRTETKIFALDILEQEPPHVFPHKVTPNPTPTFTPKTCGLKSCANFGKEVPQKFRVCGECGTVPINLKLHEPTGRNCGTKGCDNFGQEVPKNYRFCGVCGKPPPEPEPARTCGTKGCDNFGQEVPKNYRVCGVCGKPPPEINKPPKPLVCGTNDCENFGKEIPKNFKVCGMCGNPPPEINKPPKPRVCGTNDCDNFGNVVPEKFKVCAMCGNPPSSGNSPVPPKPRVCSTTDCDNFRQEVPQKFKVCPMCGNAPQ